MKKTLILSLMLALPAFAGSSQVMAESAPPSPDQDLWSWFVGASGGYLFDYNEDMYTLQLGAKSPWSVSEWSISFFGEVGWTENHDNVQGPGIPGGVVISDLEIVPVTFNVVLSYPVSGALSAYLGGGLGLSYVDTDITAPFPGFDESQDDWVFTGQLFAGLTYEVNDSFEVFGGIRWIYFDDPDIDDVSLGDDCLIEAGIRFRF